MADQLKISCASCGSDQFDMPTDPDPNDIIKCTECGAGARYADVQADGLKQAKEHLAKSFRAIFSK